MRRRELLAALTAPILAANLKPRLRPALCAYTFRDALKSGAMKYEDLITFSAQNELDGVDLTVYWFPSSDHSFLAPLKRRAYVEGIEIYSLSIRTDMCKPPGTDRDKQLEDVKRWVEAATELGAGHIRVFGGTVPKGHSEDEAVGWAAESLAAAADYAGTHGVILGLENHHGITDKAARIVEIVRKVNSPWAKINLDTGNFNTRIYEQIEMLAPYAVNVQVKVQVTDESGAKPSDWDRVAKMLVANRYRGYLALEHEAKEDPFTTVPGYLTRLREVCVRYS